MDKKTAKKFMAKIEDLASSMSKYAARDGDSWNDKVALRAIKSLNAAYDHLEDIEESYSRKGRMLKEEATETYIVPDWTLPYLFNDDPSGLNDDEIEAVDKFVESLPSGLFDASEDTFFASRNDLPGEQGRLGNTCVELTVVVNSEG